MQGLPRILSLFRSEFDKFNNTGAQMLDLFITCHQNCLKIQFWHEMVRTLPSFMQRSNGRH